MNPMEDRLRAALHARADQVRGEDLAPLRVPGAGDGAGGGDGRGAGGAGGTVLPFRRRATTWLVVAAAACAAIVATGAVVVVSGGLTDQRPDPAAPPTAGAGQALVDLDGDGVDDLVGTGRDGVPYVAVTGGDTVAYPAHAATLEGVATVEGTPVAVFRGAVEDDSISGAETLVLAWSGGAAPRLTALRPVEDGQPQRLGTNPDAPVLVGPDGQLVVVGRVGPEDDEGRRPIQAYTLRADATATEFGGGGYTSALTPDTWCFEGAEGALVRCDVDGPLDSTADVGDPGDVEGLVQGEVSPGLLAVGQAYTTPTGERVGLVGRVDGEGAVTGEVRLEVRGGPGSSVGTLRSDPLPEGTYPSLWATVWQVGQAGDAYVVQVSGGDQETWRVYVPDGDRLVEARGPDGGEIVQDATTTPWWTGTSLLYTRTRVEGDEQRYRLESWQVGGPGEGGGGQDGPPSLRSEDLGDICVDTAVVPRAAGTC